MLDFFLNSGNLVCRSTGISMYFRESLGVRDNESRLYIIPQNWRFDRPVKCTTYVIEYTPLLILRDTS